MIGADSEGFYAGAGTGQNAAENNAVQALALAAGAVFILGAAGITIVATDKALNGEISNAELGQQFLTAVEMDVKNSYTMGWMFSDETTPDTSKEGFDIQEDKGLILTTPAHENGVYVEEFPVAEDYDNTLVTYPEDNLPDSNDGGFSILPDWLTNLGNVLFNESVKPLDVGTYGDLSPNSVGDGLTPDHIPSFAAIVKNIEVSSGIKLTEEQKTSLRLNTNCLVYSTCTQQQESRNYGGRNNPTQIEQDSQDLRAAALRDIENIRGSLINQGYNAEDVDRSFQQLLDLNKKAGIHE
jgi:hypothetical protein